MDLGIAGHVALVTGSSRGIGKAIAAELIQEGARVFLSGRNQEDLAKAKKELSIGASGRVDAYRGDLSRTAQVRSYLRAGVKRWGRVDIAVANIGSGRGVSFEQSDEREWLRVFQENFFCAMTFIREVLPIMKRQKGGSICLISSIAGKETLPAPVTYMAAKSGLMSAGKSLSRLLAVSKIRVNVVAPGNVLFPGGSWDRRLKKEASKVRRFIKAEVPLQRFATPEEIAACVTFLCSPRAAFVTGECLVVDGGQTRAF